MYIHICERQGERDSKELACMILGPGKSEFYRVDQQAGDPGKR